MWLSIVYYQIFGLPLVGWLGIVSLALLSATALFPWLKNHGWIKVSFIWHPRLAKLAVAVAIIHGIVALTIYL
jgi:hypothetical protein